MTKEISLRPVHFQNFHKGSENAVIESERLPGWVSFATIFLSKRRRRSLFHGSAPHEASVGRVCRKKHLVRSSPQRSRSLQARRLRNIRPTAQRWMWGLRPICGPVSQRLISPAGRIRPGGPPPRGGGGVFLFNCCGARVFGGGGARWGGGGAGGGRGPPRGAGRPGGYPPPPPKPPRPGPRGGAGLIVSIRLSRSRYLAAAAFLLLRDRAWMPSTTSTIARTTSRMAMIART